MTGCFAVSVFISELLELRVAFAPALFIFFCCSNSPDKTNFVELFQLVFCEG